MPTYEYLCETNGRVLEVRHKMAEQLATWGELCARAGVATGRTDPRAPVRKLISAGFIGSGAPRGAGAWDGPVCGSGACEAGECATAPCGGGMCGLAED